MTAPSVPAAVRYRRAAATAALVAFTWPASAEVFTIIRYRSGNKDTIVAQQTRTGGIATSRTVRGTASSNAYAHLSYPGVYWAQSNGGLVRTHRGPRFQAKAEGMNPKDTTAPAGKSDDRLNTWAEVRFGETLTIPDAVDFDLSLKVHGTATAQGANGAGFARIALIWNDPQLFAAGREDGTSDAPRNLRWRRAYGHDHQHARELLPPFRPGQL
jgi:hypothetical protein